MESSAKPSETKQAPFPNDRVRRYRLRGCPWFVTVSPTRGDFLKNRGAQAADGCWRAGHGIYREGNRWNGIRSVVVGRVQRRLSNGSSTSDRAHPRVLQTSWITAQYWLNKLTISTCASYKCPFLKYPVGNARVLLRHCAADMMIILDGDRPEMGVRDAIKYAEQDGWTFVKASARAHIYGTLYCPPRTREGHRQPVYSTPRSSENHARRIREEVDNCDH